MPEHDDYYAEEASATAGRAQLILAVVALASATIVAVFAYAAAGESRIRSEALGALDTKLRDLRAGVAALRDVVPTHDGVRAAAAKLADVARDTETQLAKINRELEDVARELETIRAAEAGETRPPAVRDGEVLVEK